VHSSEYLIPSSSLSLICEAALGDRLFRLLNSVGQAFGTEPLTVVTHKEALRLIDTSLCHRAIYVMVQ
jgi:hypothetical protein